MVPYDPLHVNGPDIGLEEGEEEFDPDAPFDEGREMDKIAQLDALLAEAEGRVGLGQRADGGDCSGFQCGHRMLSERASHCACSTSAPMYCSLFALCVVR